MGTHDPDCFFRDKTLLPGQGHGPLAHEYDILTLVLSGRLDEMFANGTQRCGRWELHYKPRGAQHATATGPAGVRMFILGLRGNPLEGLKLPDAPRVLGGGAPAVRALGAFVSLADSQQRRRNIDRDSIKRLTDCLEPQINATTPDPPVWITEAHDRVHKEDNERTSLEQLAREFRVHAVYLARAFRKHYGRSIGSLRRRVRVDRAINRLVGGTRSLADLAHDLGYADQSHFTRDFKKETGWSPGRFHTAIGSFGGNPLA